MEITSKAEAQRRADQIAAFRAELAIVERDGVLLLGDSQRTALDTYHRDLLARLTAAFDVDASSRDRQLSLGMKVASFLGALGLAASVFFLFYQFWGRFSTAAQTLILMAAPVAGLVATMSIAAREKTGYFSKLAGLVTLACFVLNLSTLGQIYNIAPSPNAFLVWAAFACLLAYAADARLLLAFAIIAFAAFLSARAGTWSGCYWLHFGERPENFLPAAVLLLAASWIPHRRFSGFAPIYRVFGLLLALVPFLILANWGRISYLDLDAATIEGLYQLAGFAFSAAAIWLGIRLGAQELVNTGNVFFTVFLYTKFYDWWWDWLPKYLFFLIIGLTAIVMLLVLKRLRDLGEHRPREVSR